MIILSVCSTISDIQREMIYFLPFFSTFIQIQFHLIMMIIYTYTYKIVCSVEKSNKQNEITLSVF